MIDAELIKKAEEGDLDAMKELAAKYADKNSPDINHERAFALYCNIYRLDPSDHFAAVNLVIAYAHGVGTPADEGMAYKIALEHLASANDDAGSMALLGIDWEHFSIEKQIAWFDNAASNGASDAYRYLAFIYSTGLYGIEIDKSKADHYAEMCASSDLSTGELKEWIAELKQKCINCDKVFKYVAGQLLSSCANSLKFSKRGHVCEIEKPDQLDTALDQMRCTFYPEPDARVAILNTLELQGAAYFGLYIDDYSAQRGDVNCLNKAISAYQKAVPFRSDAPSKFVREYINLCAVRARLEGKSYDGEIYKTLIDYSSKYPQGGGEAMMGVAVDYVNGDDCLPQDTAKAFFYTKKAVELGNTQAKENLMKMYFLGIGTAKNYRATQDIATELAPSGNFAANQYLGIINADGLLGYCDLQAAEKYLNAALSLAGNDENALRGTERILAIVFKRTQRYLAAFRIYEKYALKSDPDSEYDLGIMYYNGWGTEQNLNICAYWMRRSASHGNKSAIDFIRSNGISLA